MFYRDWVACLRRFGLLSKGLKGEQLAEIHKQQVKLSQLAWLFKPVPRGDRSCVEYNRERRNLQRELVLLLADYRCPVCRRTKVGSAQYIIDAKQNRFLCVSCSRAGAEHSLREWLEELDPELTAKICALRE